MIELINKIDIKIKELLVSRLIELNDEDSSYGYFQKMEKFFGGRIGDYMVPNELNEIEDDIKKIEAELDKFIIIGEDTYMLNGTTKKAKSKYNKYLLEKRKKQGIINYYNLTIFTNNDEIIKPMLDELNEKTGSSYTFNYIFSDRLNDTYITQSDNVIVVTDVNENYGIEDMILESNEYGNINFTDIIKIGANFIYPFGICKLRLKKASTEYINTY